MLSTPEKFHYWAIQSIVPHLCMCILFEGGLHRNGHEECCHGNRLSLGTQESRQQQTMGISLPSCPGAAC